MTTHYVELDEEEFQLICNSVAASVDVHERASNASPTDEDSMIENEYYLKYRQLQEKFPDPGEIGLI